MVVRLLVVIVVVGVISLMFAGLDMIHEDEVVRAKAQGLALDGKPKMHNKTLLFSELNFATPPTFDGKFR